MGWDVLGTTGGWILGLAVAVPALVVVAMLVLRTMWPDFGDGDGLDGDETETDASVELPSRSPQSRKDP